MSQEINFIWTAGESLFAEVYKNDSGIIKVNISGGDTWQVWDAGNVSLYAIDMSEIATGVYACDFPAIAAGEYFVKVSQGTAKDGTDTPVGSGTMQWDGSAEISLSNLPSAVEKQTMLIASKVIKNKAVQDKTTNAIIYYDDDGVTPLLTLTPTDDDQNITRVPS